MTETTCSCGRPHSREQGRRNAEIADVITSCWLEGAAPHCTADNGIDSPAWLKPGDVIWYIMLPGTLEVNGVRIPLRTKWILCPAHEYLSREEERTA